MGLRHTTADENVPYSREQHTSRIGGRGGTFRAGLRSNATGIGMEIVDDG